MFSVSQPRAHPERFHLVDYGRLTADPAATMAGIYAFLGLDAHDHDFDHVVSVDTYQDEAAVGLPTLHEVRGSIDRRSVSPDAVLSPYVLSKYGGADLPLDGTGRRTH